MAIEGCSAMFKMLWGAPLPNNRGHQEPFVFGVRDINFHLPLFWGWKDSMGSHHRCLFRDSGPQGVLRKQIADGHTNLSPVSLQRLLQHQGHKECPSRSDKHARSI